MTEATKTEPPREIVDRVTSTFLIGDAKDMMPELFALEDTFGGCVKDASEGLLSVVRTATLPFHLVFDAVNQRRFDRFAIAERIRALKDVKAGEDPSDGQLSAAAKLAQKRMNEFIVSEEGGTFIRDAVIHELNRSLRSKVVSSAAIELMIQTLVSTWAVFEHFASSFIVYWIDQDPKRSRAVLSAPDLRNYFGRQVVDIDAIANHGFDLSRSMGTVIFHEKRLDNLSVVRAVLNTIFNDKYVRDALGDDLWILNQRRHLFVHKRGLVDQEYLKRTGDAVSLGKRLQVTSDDVERYLKAVETAIISIVGAAKRANSSS